MKILILEDNIDNATLIENSLKQYSTFKAASIAQAKELIKEESFDLFLIDVQLPDGSGFDFCSELNLNESFEPIPKIILSGLSETKDKVYGFQCGAEDYISKPFSVEELRARVETRLKKRISNIVEKKIDNIKFNFQLQAAFFTEENKQTDILLTHTEFKILHAIMDKKGQLCSRHDLIREVWKKNGLNIAKSGIDSHISHIRKKLSLFPVSIHSIYNRGYLYK